MSTNKTKPTTRSVELFLDNLIPKQRKKDSWTLYRLMEKITGSQGVLWGTSIIGFGDYHYKYASGRWRLVFNRLFPQKKRFDSLFNV
jgi:hypothetical protein